MPLIILCGIPCSGKTFRASEIAAYFDSRKKKVVIINEESLKLDKNDSYADSKAEKTTRSSILAEVEKNIAGGDVVVIADSLNYIRGFRYELYCRGRSQRTPICLIHCNTNREITKKRNSEGEKQWNTKLFDELSDRFELPNARNRWERPLITLNDDEKTPVEDVYNILFENSILPNKNIATEYKKLEEPNFFFEMDQRTQSIVTVIMDRQNMLNTSEIIIPNSTQKVLLKRKVTLAELQRIRKQFIKLNTVKPQPIDSIADSFVIYLNANLSL